MKMWIPFFVTAFLLTASLRAETLEHGPSGLHVDTPAGWSHAADGDVLVISNPAGDLVLMAYVGSDNSAKEFVDHIAKELDHIVKNAKVTKGPRTEKVNNLTQDYIEGTGALVEEDHHIPKGEKVGESVDWDLTLVTGGKSPLVVVAFGKIAENQKAIDAVYKSIKK